MSVPANTARIQSAFSERSDDGCWVPMAGMEAFGGALRNVGAHDWRLIDERPALRPVTEEDQLERQAILKLPDLQAQVAMGRHLAGLRTGGTERRWYCARCRRVESTVAEG